MLKGVLRTSLACVWRGYKVRGTLRGLLRSGYQSCLSLKALGGISKVLGDISFCDKMDSSGLSKAR